MRLIDQDTVRDAICGTQQRTAPIDPAAVRNGDIVVGLQEKKQHGIAHVYSIANIQDGILEQAAKQEESYRLVRGEPEFWSQPTRVEIVPYNQKDIKSFASRFFKVLNVPEPKPFAIDLSTSPEDVEENWAALGGRQIFTTRGAVRLSFPDFDHRMRAEEFREITSWIRACTGGCLDICITNGVVTSTLIEGFEDMSLAVLTEKLTELGRKFGFNPVADRAMALLEE